MPPQGGDLTVDIDAANKAVGAALAGIDVLTARTSADNQPPDGYVPPQKPRITARSQSLSSRALHQASQASMQYEVATGRPRFNAMPGGFEALSASGMFPPQRGGGMLVASGIHPALQGQHQHQFLMRQAAAAQWADDRMSNGGGQRQFRSAPLTFMHAGSHHAMAVPHGYQSAAAAPPMGSAMGFNELQLHAQMQLALQAANLQADVARQQQQQQHSAWVQAQAMLQHQQQQQQHTAALLVLQQQQQQPSQHQQLQALFQQQLLMQQQQQQLLVIDDGGMQGAASLRNSGTSGGAFLPQQPPYAGGGGGGSGASVGAFLPRQPSYTAAPHGGGGGGIGPGALPQQQLPEMDAPQGGDALRGIIGLYEDVASALIGAARQQGDVDMELRLQVSLGG